MKNKLTPVLIVVEDKFFDDRNIAKLIGRPIESLELYIVVVKNDKTSVHTNNLKNIYEVFEWSINSFNVVGRVFSFMAKKILNRYLEVNIKEIKKVLNSRYKIKEYYFPKELLSLKISGYDENSQNRYYNTGQLEIVEKRIYSETEFITDSKWVGQKSKRMLSLLTYKERKLKIYPSIFSGELGLKRGQFRKIERDIQNNQLVFSTYIDQGKSNLSFIVKKITSPNYDFYKNPLLSLINIYSTTIVMSLQKSMDIKTRSDLLKSAIEEIELKPTFHFQIEKSNFFTGNNMFGFKHECGILQYFLKGMDNDKLLEKKNLRFFWECLYIENIQCNSCKKLIIKEGTDRGFSRERVENELADYILESHSLRRSKRFTLFIKIIEFLKRV